MTDYDPQVHPERVLISYSHDSPTHVDRVLALAARLRGDGVFVMLDQYEPHPAEGWPQWMRREIAAATHVLIACTEPYLRRVNLREAPGKGLGATWEGSLVVLATYASQGLNEKFIPVVFSAADQAFIPDFLQGVARYDLSTDDGYHQLYARLTAQQLVPVPPLGPRRTVGAAVDAPRPGTSGDPARPESDPVSAAPPDLLLIEANGATLFLPLERIQEHGTRAEFVLVPSTADDSAFLGELKHSRSGSRVWVVYGDAAYEGSVAAADRTRDASGERWRVTVALEEQSPGYLTEMGTSGKSVDDIAELRARRILLDERPPADVARWGQLDSTLEMLVQGLGTRHPLKESPLPALYRQMEADRPFFLAAARLSAVLELRRSGTVEHILELAMRMEGERQLHVRFRGRRRKMYTNMPAHEMTFEGVCRLK